MEEIKELRKRVDYLNDGLVKISMVVSNQTKEFLQVKEKMRKLKQDNDKKLDEIMQFLG